MPAVALTIAGSDPSGGAGIQADLKTFHQFQVYGEAVLTLVTVQNTKKVSRVETLPAALVAEQIRAVASDIRPAAAKTGALGNIEIVEMVAALARDFTFPLVVDPAMISKHGARLLPDDAAKVLARELIPNATLLTPNIPEAEALIGHAITDRKSMIAAAKRLLDLGCRAVLIKAGHLAGSPDDVLLEPSGPTVFPGARVDTPHTHGTGCTYSAAITAGLALGMNLHEAISRAKQFVQRAIETAPALGQGRGPLNHFAAIG